MSVVVTESTAQQPPSHLLLHRRSSGRGWCCSLARLVRSWGSRARHQRHELVVTLRPGRPRDPYAGERARSLCAVDEDLRRASPASGCWHRGEVLQYTPVRHFNSADHAIHRRLLSPAPCYDQCLRSQPCVGDLRDHDGSRPCGLRAPRFF
jgi:hypothetical protein